MKRATSYLLIRLVLCFSEEADVLDEPGLDVFIVHKLAEDVELLLQELVGEIHLRDNGGGTNNQIQSGLRGKRATDRFNQTPLTLL